MYQEFTGVGHAVNQAEMRYTPSGVPVASFKLAINKSWNDANGNKQEKALFIKIVCWRKLAEIVSQYVEKGRQLLVVGELEEPEQWTDRDGNQRVTMVVTATTIKLLGSKGTGNPSNGNEAPQGDPGQVDGKDVPF